MSLVSSFLFPLFLFLHLCFSSDSSMLCLPHESQALLLFKQSFSLHTSASTVLWDLHDSYPKTDSWNPGTGCCSWDGVTCDSRTGSVIGLNLSYSMLYGSISSDNPLFSLSHLQSLDLSHNHFNSSPISPQFGYLFDLFHLNLNSSKFSGSVPPQISYLSSLVSLDLSGNDVLTVDSDTFDSLVSNLTKLEEFSFNGVDLSSVSPNLLMNLPSSLSTLKLGSCGLGPEFIDYIPVFSRLLSLDLSDNDLQLNSSSFDKMVQNFWRLRELDLSYVNLSSVSLSNLPSSLSVLYLSSSSLRGKFPDIFHLSELVSLDLSENAELEIDQSVFDKLTISLPKLEKVDLSWMNLSSINPVSLLNLSSSLSSLFLIDCRLQGEFPASLIQRPNLKKLGLRGNEQLDGSLPSSNWSSSLQSLDLSSTKIPIFLQPDFFTNFKPLKRLYLIGCNFIGSNLDLFGGLRELTVLDLSFNNFSGEIPSSFQNLDKLQVFSIRNNNFSGPVPGFFENFKQLIYLSVTYNRLTGSISSVARTLSNLVYLNLSVNAFNGTIPSSLFAYPFLDELYFNDNQLHGSIDTAQINSNSLMTIDLSNNKLSGRIPSFQSNSLSFLKLANNMFNGTIPSSLYSLPRLEQLLLYNNQLQGIGTSEIESDSIVSIDFGNNKLKGSIPSFRSDSLLYIGLKDNRLSGPIPDSVFSVVNLKALMLSSNGLLNGSVSSSLCKLHFLEIIDLSNNTFDGFIPPCLGNFSTSLSVLHFGLNRFRGNVPDTFSEGCNLRYFNLGGNQLQGRIPNSIINCKDMELIDLSNNKINDTFPYLMGTLPHLQVLIIRSNNFHGPVKTFNSSYSFGSLRIFDISSNGFTGQIPKRYFDQFEAMMSLENGTSTYMGSQQNYTYGYSVKLVLKGFGITLEKILTLLTSIDLSSNNFTGKIPESIGKLNSLKQLNLSHNHLTGNIEPSLANLTNLESLDLSWNMLGGRIPMELTGITFLQVFRVAYNRLVGLIPHGKQFNTFDTSSYEGNSGLCGHPLEKCKNEETYNLAPSEEEDSDGIGWISGLAGYGCGVVFGIVMGYLVFTTGNPEWFVKRVEGFGNGIGRQCRIKRNTCKSSARFSTSTNFLLRGKPASSS